MKISLEKNKTSYVIFCLLLIYMPLHYYICELFLSGIKIDNILRDIVIVFLLLLVLSRNHFKIKRTGWLVFLNCIILLVFAVFSMILFQYPSTFNILRTYLVPSLMFFICNQMEFDKTRFVKIHRIMVVELAIIAAYGFIQAFFLGDDFIINLGYESSNGFLAGTSYYIGGFFGYQRSVGTFVSPNVCGVILSIALCIYFFSRIDLRLKHRYLVLGMLIVGLLATFSRSAILGFVLAWIFILIIMGKFKAVKSGKIIKIFAFAIAAIITILVIDRIFLNNLFTSMLSSSFSGMLTKTDSSTAKHLTDLTEPIEMVLSHPFGLGFGNNGSMALETSATANTVESSIYLMMYELGIVFGLMFFIPYVGVIVRTFVNRKYKYYVPAAVSITVMFTYILLPNVQTYEILFYSYVFIGLYYNQSVKRLFMNTEIR